MGNGDYNTENLKLETHFPWRTSTEPCGLWAFQATDPPGEHRWVQGPQSWKAGLVGLSSGKGSHLLQTDPAPRQPLPNLDHCREGEVCRLFLFFFFFLT